MTTGKVKWFNFRKGYGFITESSDNGSGDIFVHFSGIAGEEDKFKTLHQDDEVEFDIMDGEKGKEARNVVVTKPAPRKKKIHKKQSPAKVQGTPQEE